jgi:hypothetical protein
MPGLLPSHAVFPVFGLVPGLLEPRWLELWDSRRPWSEQVWRVGLGHGDAAANGPRVIVTTVPRLGPARIGEIERGPTQADDAIGWAQQSMLHAVVPAFAPDSAERGEWWRRELELAAWLSRHPDAAEWERLTVPVSGHPVMFRLRRHGPAWAAFTELKTGWLALDGIHVDPVALRLDAVSADDYATTSV